MSIKSKLLSLIVGLVLIGAISSSIGYIALVNSNKHVENIIKNETVFRVSMLNLHIINLNLRRYEKDYLLNTGNSESQASYLSKFEENIKSARLLIKEQKVFFNKDGFLYGNSELEEAMSTVSTSLENYRTGFIKATEKMDSDPNIGPQEGNLLLLSNKENSYLLEDSVDILKTAADEMLVSKGANTIADSKLAMIIMIIVIIGVLLVSTLIGLLLALNISRPIARTAAVLKDISEGEGDLTRKLDTNRKDEVGEMGRYFNLTLKKLRTLIVSMKNQIDSLSESGETLSTNMNETASAVNEISANIKSIRNQTEGQASIVEETTTTLEEVTNSIKRLNGEIEEQFTAVSESSSAIEQMLANIDSVNRTLKSNSENIDLLQVAATEGRKNLDQVNLGMIGIAGDSEKLLEISTVIQNIASQTNLLSMNAAIEAAHAGDAGKGFAVVADEIGKLAATSGTQAKTVSSELQKIKSKVDKSTEDVSNVLVKFELIEKSIKSVTNQEESIRAAMQEQGEGGTQILSLVGKLKEISGNVRENSSEILTGSLTVIERSAELTRITSEITGSMNEMASGAEQITQAVVEVNDLSISNRVSIDELSNEAGNFKVE